MHELINQGFSLVRKAWLCRRWALPVTVAICVVGWAIVLALPDKYLASTRVYVDTQNTLGQMVKGIAISAEAAQAELVRVARRSLLSRPNIERVIRETDLDIDIHTPAERDRLIEDLRDSIRIIGGSTRGARSQENIFTIEYEDTNPQRAAAIVSALLDIFTETVLGGNRRDSDESARFFDRQIQDYEQRMRTAEQQLQAFKREHPGLAGTSSYFTALEQHRNAISEQRLALRGIELQRAEIERQLRALNGGSADTSAQDPDDAERQQQARHGLDVLQQIQSAQAQLRELRLRYTDSHPDVVALKSTIAQLEAEARASGAFDLVGDSPQAAPVSADATDSIRAELRVSLARLEAEYVAAKARMEEYEGRLERLLASTTDVPELESELNRLTAAYELARTRYNQLIDRQEAARMGREVDLSTDQSLFQILEPPRVPTLPVGPNRTVLVSFVLLVGLGAGAGLGIALSQVRPTFGDVNELARNTDLMVLGRVSLIRTAEEQRRHLLSYVAYAGAGAALLLAYAYVLLVHTMHVDLSSVIAVWA